MTSRFVSPPKYCAIVCAMLALAFVNTSDGADPGPTVPNLSGVSGSARDGLSRKLDFHTDLFTGKFGYQIPILTAPGRQGTGPNVDLQYTSGGGNDWCGVGWDLDLGYIQRDTRWGVPFNNNWGFVYSVAGKQGRLVFVTGVEYRSLIEGVFLKFEFVSGTHWRVTDNDGTEYYFGEAAASRQTGVAGTFRWALNRTIDKKGNVARYQYVSQGGRLYPSRIDYNENGALAANLSVEFQLETRPDVTRSMISGSLATMDRRLKRVYTRAGTQQVRRYELEYQQSPATQRSRLWKIWEFGSDNVAALPAQVFTYSDQQLGFSTLQSRSIEADNAVATWWRSPGATKAENLITRTLTSLMDINGDGVMDRVMQDDRIKPDFTRYNDLRVQLGSPSEFSLLSSWNGLLPPVNHSVDTIWWGAISASDANGGWPYSIVEMNDLNGDHLPDRVMWDTAASDWFQVQWNYGAGFTALYFVVVGADGGGPVNQAITRTEGTYQPQTISLLDINGDGLADRVLHLDSSANLRIQYGQLIDNQFTFSAFTTWTLPAYFSGKYAGVRGSKETVGSGGQQVIYHDLIDINGDGLPDRVIHDPASSTVFKVQLNNGSGFVTGPDWGPVQGSTTTLRAVRATDVSGAPGQHIVSWADMNADGLVDRLVREGSLLQCQFNTGSGFTALTTLSGTTIDWIMQSLSAGGWYTPDTGISSSTTEVLDINGDGLPDRVMQANGTPPTAFRVQVSQGPFPDFLTQVANGIGGILSVSYVATTTGGTSPLLPFPMYVVSQVSRSDGFGSEIFGYTFQSGYYNSAHREFRGFAMSEEEDPLGKTTRTWYHQGEGSINHSVYGEFQDVFGKQGIPWLVETLGNGGTPIYNLTYNHVVQRQVHGNKALFPYIDQTITVDQEGLAVSKRKSAARRFFYDGFGNLTRETNYGHVTVTPVSLPSHTFTDVTGDERLLDIQYYTTLGTIRNGKSVRALYSGTSPVSGSQTSRTEYTYFTTGNLQQLREWINHTGWHGDAPVAGFATTDYTYDAYGNLQTQTDPSLIQTVFGYDTATRTHIASRTVNTFVDTFEHDLRSGHTTRQVDAKGLVTEFVYDPFFRLSEEWQSVVPNGPASAGGRWKRKLEHTLNGIQPINGKLISQNSLCERTADDTLDGHVVFHYSDGLGRPVQTRKEHETATFFRVTDTFYDALGNVVFTSWPRVESGIAFTSIDTPVGGPYVLGAGVVTDELGRPRQEGSFSATITSHNISAPLAANTGDVGSPLGLQLTSYTETIVGQESPWVTIKTDALGKVTKYQRDAYDRIVRVTEMIGGVAQNTFYDHNTLDKVFRITDAELNVITFDYDSLSRQKLLQHPDLGTWKYLYDGMGRLIARIDGSGNRMEAEFNDEIGRVTFERFYLPGQGIPSSTVQYTYDVPHTPWNYQGQPFTVFKGQLARVISKEETIYVGYDLFGNVNAKIRDVIPVGIGNPESVVWTPEIRFTHDVMNRVRQIYYRSDVLFDFFEDPVANCLYTYDAGGHLQAIDGIGMGMVGEVYYVHSFDNFDRPISVWRQNSATDHYVFYPNSRRLKQRRVTNSLVGQPTSVNRLWLEYTYDQVGNLKGLSDMLLGSGLYSLSLQNILYDDLHRLKELNSPAFGIKRFDYSPTGNLLKNEDTSPNPNQYGAQLCSGGGLFPHAIRQDGEARTFCYTSGGLMQNNGLRSQTYTYDERRQLTAVGTSQTHGYDYAGKRLWAADANGWATVYVDEDIEFRYHTLKIHVYANGQRVLTCSAQVLGGVPQPGIENQFYHADYLGSIRLTTDISGNHSIGINYSAYGDDKYAAAMPDGLRFGFTGKRKDDTGLYYYESRYYDPALGRFLQPDPVFPDLYDPQALNPYSYVRNNPLRYNDPTGNYFESAIEIASLGFGIKSLIGNIKAGKVGAAIVDGIGIIADGAALAVPVVPGGAGLFIKGVRGTAAVAGKLDKAANTTQTAVETAKAAASGDLTKVVQTAGEKVGGKVLEKSLGKISEGVALKSANGGPKLLNQFNSVDSLLQNAGTFTKLKGGVQQSTIKGNGQSIFNAISQGGQKLPSGAVKMADGTILNRHISPKFGEFTIDVNRAGQIFKIRVNP